MSNALPPFPIEFGGDEEIFCLRVDHIIKYLACYHLLLQPAILLEAIFGGPDKFPHLLPLNNYTQCGATLSNHVAVRSLANSM